MSERWLTIKEVSIKTGLSTQLIRKWEERYGAVSPSRFPNGYRGYTSGDVETLLWLRGRVEEGVPIGLAASELRALVPVSAGATSASSELQPIQPPGDSAVYRQELLQLFLRLDPHGAQQWFDRLLPRCSMDWLLLQVLAPVLEEVGYRWECGEISEYQEHFGSHFIRERLLALKNPSPISPDAPLIVTACSPGEHHELGVLFLGWFLRQAGYSVVYLGAAPSEKGMLDCLRQMKPAALAFGSSSPGMLQEALPFYHDLDRQIAGMGLGTKVFLGGRAIGEDGGLEGTRAVYKLTGSAGECVGKMQRLLG
ncbi:MULTISPECIES: MerR family transcriptional regulator [Paenibacillus]|uniref:MerR family transcriptional regulator n=1 Tax=Paenibacillus TaxID=44249 RepID=UPI0022B93EF3|nr:cobalamin B12-binding domain-containing protein [Paenibacillus caseinilyticus]MCZ8520213.1 cobalamin B12-binding domain-containing protein [Paenibacillus caseinilyticus]